VHSRVHDLGSDRGRSAAPFSRQRITGALSAGGMLGRRLPIDSGVSVMCAASNACGERPTNYGCPVKISYASSRSMVYGLPSVDCS